MDCMIVVDRYKQYCERIMKFYNNPSIVLCMIRVQRIHMHICCIEQVHVEHICFEISATWTVLYCC